MKEYVTSSVAIVSWLAMKGFNPIKKERVGMYVMFTFVDSESLRNEITKIRNNTELLTFANLVMKNLKEIKTIV